MADDVYYDRGGAVFNVKVPTYSIDSAGATDSRDAIEDLANNTMGGVGTMVFPPGDYQVGQGSLIESTLDIPEGVTLAIANGACLNMWDPAQGHAKCTLCLYGTLEAGLYQIFGIEDNKAPVQFGPRSTVVEVYPEWFGAIADSYHDCSPAIQAAVDSLPDTGGIVRFSSGHYRIESEIVVAKHGVQFQGGIREGKPLPAGSGSYLVLGADLAAIGPGPGVQQQSSGAMVRFAQIPHPKNPSAYRPSMGCGVAGLSFVNDPRDGVKRRFACEAAAHVQASDAFTMDGCTFRDIRGRAIRATRSVQSHFTNIKVTRCGAGRHHAVDRRPIERPAVHIDGPFTTPTTGSGDVVVQGSVFSGFRIEGCFGAPFLSIRTTGELNDNSANKFDDIGFESYEAGDLDSDDELVDSAQTMLYVAADRNQFGKLHFWRVGNVATEAKLRVDADQCEFGELLFSGMKGIGGSVEIRGSSNTVGSIVLRSARNEEPGTAADIRVRGDDNRIGQIAMRRHPSGKPNTPDVRSIEVTGHRNHLGNVNVEQQQGLFLEGQGNVVVSYVARDARVTALTIRGSHNVVQHARITDCTVPNGPVVRIANPAGIEGQLAQAWIQASRVCVEVEGAPYASEGIEVSGSRVELLPGSRVRDVPNGYGLRWSGPRGGWRGLEIEEIGLDGIFVDGGTPVSMHDWTARRCGTRARDDEPGWGGFRATVPAYSPERASCTGFSIRQDGSTHLYSLRIEPASSNQADHEHWLIRGNVSDGGPFSIPPTVRHGVDLDSDGQGSELATDATLKLALEDSAAFFTVSGTHGFDTLAGGWKGRRVTLLFSQTMPVYDGTGNVKLQGTGTFTATADDTLTLICDGSGWYEVSRSVN